MNSLVYYAIGDIHGEADKLRRLHDRIYSTHETDFTGLPFRLVHLGDYIDRGPESCAVIDYLMEVESTLTLAPLNLKGNHEQMMIDAYTPMTCALFLFG